MSSLNPSLHGLHAVEAKQAWRGYIRDIWRRRDFLIVVPRQDARSKQMTNVLGQAWHLLNPALMIAIYYLIFGRVLKGNRGVDFYVTFLTVGILFFQLTQRIIVDAATTIQRHLGLIRTIQFPRALLPMSDVVEHLIAFLPTLILLYIVAFLERVPLRWSMVLLPAALLPVVLIAGGIALLTARTGATIPDLKDLLPHVFRLLLYTSGVIFSLDAMIENDAIRSIMKINPVYLMIAVPRWMILGSSMASGEVLMLFGWCVIFPLVGFVAFRAREHSYGA